MTSQLGSGAIIVDQDQLVGLETATDLLLDSTGKLAQAFGAPINRDDNG